VKARHLDILWLAAFSALTLWMCGAFGAELPAYRTLPGWHKTDQCYPFSRAFVDACNDSGVPAVRLTYDWRHADGTSGRHCVVLFKHRSVLWLMDNQHSKPWKVTGGETDLAILRRHTCGAYRMVNIVTLNPRAPQTLAELFPVL